MFDTFRNSFRIPELRKKILYSLLMLLIFRLCTFIPTPGVNPSAVSDAVNGSFLGIIDVITGGALQNYTFMAMGITPYINASIILQLLQVVIPKLDQMAKEGPEGRAKINQITRYSALVLAFLQAVGICYSFEVSGSAVIVSSLSEMKWFAYLLIGVSLTAGSALAMWIGERITEKGIGNGISLLIFIGIVAKMPPTAVAYIQSAGSDERLWWFLIPIVIGILALIALIIFVDLGERRIPIQYAKRVSGRKVYGGQSTYMPLKPNSGGVLPLIFAISLLTFPTIITQIFAPNGGFATFYSKWLGSGTWGYAIASVFLVIGFAFFYSEITFNPVETSQDIQKYGGFIQGIRPGRPTSDYLKRINHRLVLFGGLFLAFIAAAPMIVTASFGSVESSQTILNLALTFGTTGILIMVSVAIEVTKQLQSEMVMRHYKGFLD